MWPTLDWSRRACLALAVVALTVAGCGTARDDGAAALAELLASMPAQALEDQLFFTDLRTEVPGFGTTLPLAAVSALGVDPTDLAAVLESGGDPVTLLAGEVRTSAVSEAAAEAGYAVTSEGGWTVFRRAAAADGAPTLAAVPAGAARRGLLVLGSADGVDAVVAGETRAGDVAWVRRLLSGLGEALHSAVLSPALTPVGVPQEEVGRLLEREGVDRRLTPYDGMALTWSAVSGEGREGAALVALGPDADAQAEASALAVRAATAPVVGEARLASDQLLDVGGPRVDRSERVVRLPLVWHDPDPGALRRPLVEGGVLFLVPGP